MSKTWPQKTNGPNREISALATCKDTSNQTRGRGVHHCVSGLVYMMMINCTPVPAIAQGVQQKHNYSTKSDSFPVNQRRHSAPSPLNSTAAWPKFGGGA